MIRKDVSGYRTTATSDEQRRHRAETLARCSGREPRIRRYTQKNMAAG